MDSEFSRKKALVFGALLLVFLAIPVTIYTALHVQETRTRAEKATVLTLSPVSQTVELNQQVDLDININPGINQVDFVKLVINFDPNKFDSNSISFVLDSATKFKYTADTVATNGQIVITLDIGSNPTDTVRSEQKIGTLSLLVADGSGGTIAGETQVTFNEALTEVRSIGETDTYLENVLSNTTPATIIIESSEPSTTPTIEPSISPGISPTPTVCPVPDQVQNVKINCPNCADFSVAPIPTEVLTN